MSDKIRFASEDYVSNAINNIKTTLANPDWNQNDETTLDYIKNRTHWVDEEENVILSETTVTANDEGLFVISDSPLLFSVGTTYKIIWNGVAYYSRCRFLQGMHVLGNEYADNGYEPYVLIVTPEGQTMAIDYNGAEELTISISEVLVHTIPEAYIPKAICDSDVFYIDFMFDGQDAGNTYVLVARQTFADLQNALNNNKSVYARVYPFELIDFEGLPTDALYTAGMEYVLLPMQAIVTNDPLGKYHFFGAIGGMFANLEFEIWAGSNYSGDDTKEIRCYCTVRMPGFRGASENNGGTSGQVPAPAVGDQDKYLRGDGVWAEISEHHHNDIYYTKTEIIDKNSLPMGDIYTDIMSRISVAEEASF